MNRGQYVASTLTSFLLVAFLAGLHGVDSLGQAQPHGTGKTEMFDSQRVFRAEFGPDGDLFTLARQSHEIVRRDSSTWQVKTRYRTEGAAGVRVMETLDFVVDSEEVLHALLAGQSSQRASETVIRRFESSRRHEDIRLSRPLLANSLRVDSRGDYYVLGLDVEDLTNALDSPDGSGFHTLFLIHKYSADGTWLGRYFPHEVPASRTQLFNFMRIFPSLSDMEIVASDKLTFLFQNGSPDFKEPLLGLEPAVYQINPAGGATSISWDAPCPDTLLTDLHTSGGELYLEWNFRGDAKSGLGCAQAPFLLQERSTGRVTESAADILALSPRRLVAALPDFAAGGTKLLVSERAGAGEHATNGTDRIP